MLNREFWKDKKVLITGHTGFKGSWLSLWLHHLGAKIVGYALPPPTEPNLFDLLNIKQKIDSFIGDIRDFEFLEKIIKNFSPEIIFHLAAQPLVLKSYNDPIGTSSTSAMGTVNLFEAVKKCHSVRAIINVTTDKCYENREWIWSYRENEPMGGDDPYSNSKACSELITSCFRNAFFNPKKYQEHRVGIATARSGNVIGGGDWAPQRLLPDCIRALLNGEKIFLRNPKAIRPWQHVLEPLSGYLILAQKLYENGRDFSEAWNFGPNEQDAKPVEWIVKKICALWGKRASYEIDEKTYPYEANYLKLDISKAKNRLGWFPKWNLEYALKKVVEWIQAYKRGENMYKVSLLQIEEYNKSQIKME